MGFDETKKLTIKPKNADIIKARGTEKASEMIKLIIDNWSQF